MNTPSTTDWLKTIDHTAHLLPDIVEGQAIPIADLHQAAAVCGWITEVPEANQSRFADLCANESIEFLATSGRMCIALAIQRLKEQEGTK